MNVFRQGEKSIQKMLFPLQNCFPFSTTAPWKKENQNKTNKNKRKLYFFKKDFNSHRTNSQLLLMANKQA